VTHWNHILTNALPARAAHCLYRAVRLAENDALLRLLIRMIMNLIDGGESFFSPGAYTALEATAIIFTAPEVDRSRIAGRRGVGMVFQKMSHPVPDNPDFMRNSR